MKYELKEPIAVPRSIFWNSIGVFDLEYEAAVYAESRSPNFSIDWGLNNLNEIVGRVIMLDGESEIIYKIVGIPELDRSSNYFDNGVVGR